jgi:zinc protease
MRELRMRALVAGVAACAVVGCGGASLAPKPAWELPAPPPEDRPVVDTAAVTRVDLGNGLRVLIHEDHRLPRVALSLTVRRGAAMEAPEDAGAVAFMAELLERGAGDRDALAFAEVVDALGAQFSTGADWDSVGVGISGLSRDLDSLLDLLADASLRPHFAARSAERARDERLAALERAKDDPATLASWQASRAIYGAHRFGLPVSGTPETVAKFDAATARGLHARLFVPNGAILSVSGDVDSDALMAMLRARFGAWPQGEVVPPGTPPPALAPASRRVVVVDRPDLGQVRIVVGHEGIARTDDDRIAVSLFNLVVGGAGFSSRLMAALRSEEGLTYGVSTGYALRRAPGPFVASTFTRVEELRKALDILLGQLERAREEPPGEDELAWARTLAVGRFALSLETSAAVTRSLADLDVYGLPEDSLDTYRSRVRAITPEDVAAAARAHLHPERTAIVLVGPAEAITPQLEGLGPVEVVEP